MVSVAWQVFCFKSLKNQKIEYNTENIAFATQNEVSKESHWFLEYFKNVSLKVTDLFNC